VNRWDALSKIVDSFNRSKRPGYALAAVLVFALPVTALLSFVVAKVIQ
jgi:hypothetical protein